MNDLTEPIERPPIKVISSDEYQSTECSLTDTCCDQDNCRTCERAYKAEQEEREANNLAEHEEFTIFTRTAKIGKFSALVNSSNIIAKTDLLTLQGLQDAKIISNTPTGYHPDKLKQYPALRKLRHYNNLGIPDRIWAAKDHPAAFEFNGIYYLIAPRIEE